MPCAIKKMKGRLTKEQVYILQLLLLLILLLILPILILEYILVANAVRYQEDEGQADERAGVYTTTIATTNTTTNTTNINT